MTRKHQLMIPSRRLTLAGGFVISAAFLSPAAAQNPLDFLFGRSQPAPQGAPPAPAKAAPSAAPTPNVLPPKRPGTEQGSSPVQAARQAPSPDTTTQAAGAVALSERQIVERANGYFNSISSLAGDFMQVGGEGRRLTGKLFLQRPGKIRFEYDAPATLEVVADGSSVAIRDKKLATQDLYSIGQTPLKFLLRERIDLGRDLKITDVAAENDGVRVSVEDKSTLGGTSKITLYFDKDVRELTRWRIVDPQGFQTSVSLANIERNPRIEQQLFAIDYTRILDSK